MPMASRDTPLMDKKSLALFEVDFKVILMSQDNKINKIMSKMRCNLKPPKIKGAFRAPF